ncbi:cell division control protein 6 homolog [Mytilus californianus]|uniref:cell division control protein 6 homolog n=1 Tax=Mytilus californianus TaxID=6549 RepID=UPI0022479A23|nr:cell division control protein 6 homolog [Mytilus californianus]
MSAIVQRKLEFPIRKSTRLRSSKDADSQENTVKPESPRKRTKEENSDKNLQCSPSKQKKGLRSTRQQTPSTDRSAKTSSTRQRSETPTTGRRKVETPNRRSARQRNAETPIRGKNGLSDSSETKTKLKLKKGETNEKMNTDMWELISTSSSDDENSMPASSKSKGQREVVAESKITEKFPFSPKKTVEPFRSPEGKSLPSPSIVPQQVIISPEYPPSPKKHLLSPRGSDHPLSPRKDLSLDHFYSPRRNLLSPKKSDLLLSPRKVMSPSRNENQFSSRNLMMSPGTMMGNLKLSSPVRVPLSPRKMDYNIMSSPGKSQGGLSLFSQGSPVKSLFSPTNSLKLEKQEAHAYHLAKQSFHTAKPDRIVGREVETETVNQFVRGHVTKKAGGSLYISGAPGTGKTAVLTHILDNVRAAHSCKSVYLNCMSLRDSATVYGKLYTDLTGKSPPSAKDRLRAVEKYLTTTGPSIIMVLDEIDQLDSKNQEILYTIFEWPSLQKSRLVLIGIANALDLTDRILPRLQARPNCKPQLLNFAPYSKDQIANIIKDRLKKIEEQGLAVMEPSAIQFCARKISAVAGDMRKALDVCRRAVELVEHEVKTQKVLSSPTKRPPAVPKKIGVVQINKVLSEVYGSSSVSNSQDSIPLQQKLIVCTLLLMVKQGKMKEVTMGKVHDTYCKICKKRQMAIVDYTEYQGICNLLETRGIMGIKKIKDGRLAKIVLKLDERELDHTLQDKILMSSIMKDGLP